MAKREKEERVPPKKGAKPEVDDSEDMSPLALTKALIKDFNKDGAEKLAWSLAFDDDNPTDVKEFISTGSTLLDYITCNRRGGGGPVGKLMEFSGEEASGKSLVIAQMIAECQRKGGIAVYIDVENSANPDFLERLGVDLKKLVYLQPPTVEDVGDAIEKTIVMTRTKAPNRLVMIAWDSIAATPTKTELDGNFELNMNSQLEKSKVISKMMRKITQMLGKERICLVFTNQLKTKIGVMYGDPLTTPGGKAVPFHASVRVRLTKSSEIKNEKTGDVVGIRTLAKVIKNRLGPPLRKCEFNIMFAAGIDDVGSWFTKLHELGEIEKAAGWCYLTSFPSGKTDDKSKDRGLQFREKDWNFLIKGNDEVKDHVLNLLERRMVVTYEKGGINDLDIDPESLMDNETVLSAVESGTFKTPETPAEG